ncbi:MAG: hypothetical protein JAY88_14650 [Candidatus Thiodiazotropha lotti]|nr:hypothetical protein [Candidatus Thiodiazotropha lotti]MCW4188303.1 hypothetical protein [Candidatus Thiodiazotropha lotti]
MILIGIVGSESARESFALQVQSYHGFCVAYSRDEVLVMKAKSIPSCLLFGVGPHEYGFIREQGALVFLEASDDCTLGDYVLTGRPSDADFSHRVRDLVWSVRDEKETLPAVTA